ncbi:SdrD B-like domain-containing protein [Lentzea sp. JNUCC 0626]|uniref:SdrD B-like domain-containing protein n=1 Tax=Lentzea sp. JNUCC 0626 TaxID=3367513 RepID=UPI003747BD3D
MLKIGVLATVALLAFGTTPALAQDDPPKVDSIAGVLYADRDENGRQDAGEEIKGAKVSLSGENGPTNFSTTTDGDGRFAFADLPAGSYWTSYELADGWVVHNRTAYEDTIAVEPGKTAQVIARAERPYSEQLKLTTKLDRAGYEFPASMKVTVTLANVSKRRIEGIESTCDRVSHVSTFCGSGDWRGPARPTGLALDPGAQVTFTVDEPIPENALPDGFLRLEVGYAPHIAENKDRATTVVEAKVTGGLGYRMLLGEDRDADQIIDSSEAVSGVKVVLLNPKDGSRITERTSDAEGKIEFGGLKDGEYQAVPLGSWGFTDDSQQRVVVPGSGGTRFLKPGAPAALTATMKLDKPRYESHETVRVDLTITNTGGQTAERVKVFRNFAGLFDDTRQWYDLGTFGPGTRIPAGKSLSLTFTGEIADSRIDLLAWAEYVGMPAQVEVTAGAEVVQTAGAITGVVYTDRNSNGQLDPGEAAANAVVEANGGSPYGYFRTTTDADGRYEFRDVPSGLYLIGYTLAGGWLVRYQTDSPMHRVRPGPPLELVARAERPFNEKLAVTAVLDKASYAIGEEAKITITLTNKVDHPVRGVQAYCNPAGKDDEFGSRPMIDSWGDLRDTGVDLAPRETKTLTVTEKVPEGARVLSRVTLNCEFSQWPESNDDGVTGYDWASIAGGTGSLKGVLAHDLNDNFWLEPGEAIPNTRVRLMTDREYGGVVAETVSDQSGTVRFEGVLPGEYWLWVDGPWKIAKDEFAHVWVASGQEMPASLWVVPGPPPTQPNQPPGDDDQPVREALARTGASVLGLGLVAVLLVAFGVGARVAGRRRT